MDEVMMKAGGEAKRKELIALFGDLSIEDKDRARMTDEEQKRAKEGEEG